MDLGSGTVKGQLILQPNNKYENNSADVLATAAGKTFRLCVMMLALHPLYAAGRMNCLCSSWIAAPACSSFGVHLMRLLVRIFPQRVGGVEEDGWALPYSISPGFMFVTQDGRLTLYGALAE